MSVVKLVVTMAGAGVWAVGIALLCTAPVAAATLTAASCSYSDVNAKVGAAASGDTVVVPAGNCAWGAGLTISKVITLKGAGVGQTFITDNFTSGSLITVQEQTTGNVRIQGFDFRVGSGPLNARPDYYIRVLYATSGKPVLVTANKFTLGNSGNALGFDTNRGVISGNNFIGTLSASTCLNNASALRHKPTGLKSSWSTPPTYGTADANGDQNLYFESNTANDVLEAIDVSDNGRLVFRYNVWTNSSTSGHGADTSYYGARYIEIYQNTYIFDQTPKCLNSNGQLANPTNLNVFIMVRGGTRLIHHNVIPDITSATWGNKSEVRFTIMNLRHSSGPYACWTGGYPVPHQAGWGYSTGETGPLSGSGVPDVYQDIEPIYIWANTGSGNYNNPAITDYSPPDCNSGDTSTNYVKLNREYYVNTAKPGYTPYIYPHPLLSGSQSAGSAALPPSNLQVQ
jgi:hypothetical protein